MRVEDLMIGDWVMIENYSRICAIAEDGVYFEDKDGRGATSFDRIKPIPLTAEILEKNGWKWNRYNTFLELVVGTIHAVWGFYPNCIGVSDWAENGDCQITSLRCEFVHKLQHILKDCRIDKEIAI